MNRPLRFLPAYIFLFLFLGIWINSFSQTATVVVSSAEPRHETTNQNQISVLFSEALTGSTPIADWEVTINSTPVNILSTAIIGSRVIVTFNAVNVNAGPDVLPLVGGVQSPVLPGQILQIKFTNSGSLLTANPPNPSTPAVNNFGFITSKNNYSLDCNELGFSGSGNYAPVGICAPVTVNFFQWTYFMSLRLRNSTNYFTGVGTFGALKLFLNYGDPANTVNQYYPYQSDNTGAPSSTYFTIGSVLGGTGPVVPLTIRPTDFTYPANSGLCSFSVSIAPEFNNVLSCSTGTLPQTTSFNSYDSDNKNTGVLAIQPSVTNANKVCLGTNANVTYSDNTYLNCEGPPVPVSASTSPNTLIRWIRIVYGYQNAGAPGNIPDIVVGGVPVTNASGNLIAPFNSNPILGNAPGYVPTGLGGSPGVPDANGVIQLSTPVTVASATTFAKNIITSSFVNQVVGQRFYVRLDYWNTCNPYDGIATSNAVNTTDFVEIIGSPNPPTVNSPSLCETATDASFEITASATGSGTLTYNWYLEPALTTLLQGGPTNTDNTFNPVTDGSSNKITKAVNGSQTFHRYVTVTQGSNNCTSPAADIVIRIDDTNTPGVIAHPLGSTPIIICSGTDPAAFTSTSDGTGGGPLGITYQWQSATNAAFTAGVTTVGTNSKVFDPPAVTSTIFYRRRISSGNCADVFSNVIEFRANTPVVAGTIGNPQTLCSGVTNPTSMTNVTAGSGGNGTQVYAWQFSTDNFVSDINTIGGATSATYDPPSALSVTTYYRRINTSGVCVPLSAASNTITMTVNQVVAPGSIDNPQTICSGDDPTALTEVTAPSGGDGTSYSFQWQVSNTGGGAGFGNATGASTSATYDPAILTATRFYRRLVSSGVCASTFSNEIEITVNPLPTAPTPTGGGAVCSGNSAPDIVWTGLTGTPGFTITYTITKNPGAVVTTVGPIAEPTTTFTISSPNPIGASGDTFDYKITALSDANCTASTAALAAIPVRQVIIGGTAPVIDSAPTISPIADCNNGASTTDPQLSLSLTVASASTSGFILNYTIDGSANRTKTFNTDGAGDIAAGTPITFADTELNNLTPSPHTVRIVSIQSPTGCLTLVGQDLSFTVNPRPALPTGAINGIACSNPGTGVLLSVTAPSAGFEIAWSTGGPALASFVAVATGTVGGINSNEYTPTTSATATFYAFMRNTTTGCLSTTGLAVTQTQDNKPAPADAGLDQPLLCGTSTTLAAAAPTNSGIGTWTVVTAGYPGIAFGNIHTRNTTVTGLTQDIPNGSAISVTLKWTVASALGVCATSDDDVVLTINPLPKALDPAPAVCADVAGGTTASNVTLSGYNDRVTDIVGSVNRTVNYYTTSARTPGAEVITPQTFATGKVFFTRVADATTNCTKDGTITFTVEQLPVATPSKSYQFCETSVGSGTATGINLVTLANADVRGGAPATAANRLIEWFEDAAFATPIVAGTGVGEDQNYTIVGIGTKTIYARVTNLASGATTPAGVASQCTNTTSIDLVLNARPANNPIQDPSGATPASITLCKSNTPLFFKVDATINPGSTYTWNVPTGVGQFQLVAGGGTNSPNFFVILAFPNQVSSPGLPITVQETINGCQGNLQTINVIVDDSPAAPVILGTNNVCENQTGVNFQIDTPNPTSTYTWTLPPLAVISGSNASKSSIFVDFNVFDGDVTVTESNPTGCTSPSAAPHHVNMFARPVITSTNTTICSGTSPNGNGYLLTSSIGGSTFNWQVVNITGTVIGTAIGNTASASQLTESITNISGSTAFVTYRVTPIGPVPGSCSGPTTDIVVTINPQPIITSPATNTICSGGTVAPFTADVIGTTFTWSVINITGSVSGTSIGDAGPGNINQTLINTSGANAVVTYRVIPKSPPPCIGAFQDIDVTVIPEPVITSAAADLVCSGHTPSVIFTSNVASSTFSWTVIAKSASVTGTTVGSAGSGNINQVLSNISGTSGTVTFRVTPQGPPPTNCVGAFQDVVVSVDPQPVMTSPATDVTCSGIAPSLVFASNLPGSSFAWTVINITGTLGGTVLGNTGAGNINEVITNTSGTDGTVTYRVIATGPLPTSCPGAFQDVVLTVAPQPVMTSLASNTICGGGAPTLVFASNIPGSTFAWVVTGTSGTVGGTAVGNTGAGNINQTLTNISGLSASVTYEVTPTGPNPNTCIGAKQVITINVIPQPNMTSSATSEICSGSTPGVLFVSDVTGSSFTWTVTGITGAVGGTSIGNSGSGNIGQTLTNTSGINGTVTYKVIPTSPAPDNCVGFPQTLVVTIAPQPVMTSTTTNTICSGLAPTLVFTSNVTSSSFAWEVVAKSGVTGGATIGNTGTGNINQLLTNTSGVNGTVTYRVTPTGPTPNSCVGAFQDVVITIIPEPVMTSATTNTICSGGTPSVVFTSNVSGSSFAWSVTGTTGTVSGTSIGSAGTGNISQVLINTSGANATVTYKVTPTGPTPSNCTGAPHSLVVTVVPEPVMTSSNANTICSGGTPTLNFIANVSGGTFAWTVTNVSISVSGATVGNSGSGNINQTLLNFSGSDGTVTYQVTPTGPGPNNCIGAPQSVVVTVVSQPVMTSTNLHTICSNTLPTLNFTSSITGSSFNWQVIAIGGSVGGTTIGNTGSGNLSQLLTNNSGVNGTVTYRVTPTGPAPNNCVGAFQDVIVTVISEPVMTSAATNKICSGSSPSVVFTSNVIGSTFAWIVQSTTGVVGGTSVGNTGTGNIAEVLTNTSGATATVTYRVTPTGPGSAPLNCPGAFQDVVVTVVPQPIMTSLAGNTICSGIPPTLVFTSNLPGSTFAWQVTSMSPSVTGTSVGSIGVGNIGHTLTNTSGLTGTVTYKVTPSGPGPENCVGAQQVVTVTVISQPSMTSANAKTICSGNTPGLSFTSNISSSTFNWEVTNINGTVGGALVGDVGSGNIGQTLINTSGTAGSVTYRVTPTGPATTNCIGAFQDVVITVTPQPVMTSAATDNICSSNTPTVIFTSNVLGSSFAWSVTNITGAISGTAVGNTGSGAITQTLVNVSNASGTVTYRVIPSGPAPLSCPGAFQDVIVTINPEPTAPLVTTIEKCSRDAVNFDLQTLINNVPSPVLSKFRYTVSVEPGPAASEVAISGLDRTTASSAQITDAFTHLAIASNADAVVVYTVTPFSTSDNCPGTPFKLRVIVHPEPRGQNASQVLCGTGGALVHSLNPQIVNGVTSKYTYIVINDPTNPLPVVDVDRGTFGNPATASAADINFSYVNTTGADATITYKVTPYSTMISSVTGLSTNCQGQDFFYTITISPQPVGVDLPVAAVCSDNAFSLDPQVNVGLLPSTPIPVGANGVQVTSYTWTAVYDAGLTVGGVAPPVSGTAPNPGDKISGLLTNKEAVVLNAVYTIFPKSGSCSGPQFKITVPISPEPVMLPSLANPPSVCSTNSVSSNPINVILDTNGLSIDADNYVITLKSKDPGLSGTPTVGTFPAVGGTSNAIANDKYRNVTAAPLKVIYTVVPKAGSCFGDAFDITVIVNPEPVLDDPGYPSVCSSNTANSNPINVILGTNGTSINATTYTILQITYSNGGSFNVTPPTGVTRTAVSGLGISLIKNDRFNNVSSLPVTVKYSIQGFAPAGSGGCASEPHDFTIVIDPEPTMVPGTSTACSGDPASPVLILSNAPGSPAITSYELKQVLISDSRLTVNPAGTNAAVGSVYTTADFLKNDIFFNVSDVNLHVIYKIVPISGLCRGIEQQVDLTVGPAPALAPGLDVKVCSSSQSGVILKDNSSGNAPLATLPYSAIAASYDIKSITVDPSLTTITTSPLGTTTNINEIKDDQYENLTNDPHTVVYRIVPISTAGCKGPETSIVVTVEPKIIAMPVNNTPDICSGTAVNVVLNSPSNPTPNPNSLPDPLITFNYSMISSSGISGSTSANNVSQGFVINDMLVNNNNNAVTVHYKVTAVAASAAGGAGCSSTQVDVAVIVEPKPKLQPSRPAQTTCEASAITGIILNSSTVASASNGTVVFELMSILDPTTNAISTTVTGNSTIGKLYNPGDALNDVLSNSSITPQVIRYTLRPHYSTGLLCAGDEVSIDITVNPRPEVTPSAATLEICSSESIEVQLPTDTDPASTIVKWTALASSIDVVGESNGAGDVLFQTLLNKGKFVQTVDYTIIPSFNGCDGPSKHLIVTVNPIPTVTLPNKITVCAGTTFNLNLAPLANTTTGTTFKWEVTDINGIATTPGEFDNTSETATEIKNQVFTNNTDASATLLYEITPIFNGVGGKCYGIPKIINVSVAPTITAAFISTDEEVCEGTPIFLTFELHGQSPFDFVYSATDANGTVNKSVTKSGNVKVDKVTPTITTIYKIVSAKDALGCTVNFTPQPEVTITVYKKITAGWTAAIPPFIGGSSIVTFTNTSTPVDGTVFDYEWTFGTDNYVIPLTNSGVGPFTADYRRPGDHYVSLRALNRAAPVELGCESSYTAKITIPVLPLVADFKFEPKAACFPQNIQVTENTATGVAMDWKVTDSNNSLVATSNANLPVFLITSPGKYKISLRSYDPLTNQEAFAPTAGKDFTIYENPVASFDVRPTLVYVPDTELTTFNFSTGAPEYLWDFGDGSTSTEPEPKYTYKIEGIYDITLIAMNDHGDGAVCTDTLSRKITAKQGGVTKVPNAFTPSPNGPSGGVAGNNTFNDVFLPIVKGAEEFNMQIFDRWGNLLFESNNSNIGWDGYNKNGHLMPAGVYVYKLTVRLSDGQRSTQLGDITMIR